MKTSTTTDLVIGAFVKALGAMDDITKNKAVKAGAMSYNYADLAAVLDAVRPHLRDNDLAVSQYPSGDGVTTVVFHKSGEYMSFPPLDIKPPGANPQQVGSAISYARRYSLLSILGLATEDDDGSLASKPAPAAPVRVDPMKAKIDGLIDEMRSLSDANKVAVKEWAKKQDRSLAAKALADDPDWLDEVTAYVGELDDSGDIEDVPLPIDE